MMPRLKVIIGYTFAMLALIGCSIHWIESSALVDRTTGITWSRFSEAPTCTSKLDELLPDRSIITVAQTSPVRIEVDTMGQCVKSYAGFVADFSGFYVLTVTSEQHLKGSFEYEVVFCMCPHRFVFEFGPEFIEENTVVFVKNGIVSATLGEL
jgi:hypothetical protein